MDNMEFIGDLPSGAGLLSPLETSRKYVGVGSQAKVVGDPPGILVYLASKLALCC